MKIVKLKAGFGNQLFQYAFYKLLAVKYGVEDIYIDTSYYNHNSFSKYLTFGLNLTLASYYVAEKSDIKKAHVIYNKFEPHHLAHRATVAVQAIFNKYYFYEKNREYVDVPSILRYSYFDGYWQSWRYLEPIREVLIKDFRPKEKLSNLSLLSIDRFKNNNTVFIGFRKGDYSKSISARRHYGTPSIDYYKRAVGIILSMVQNPYFVVFSDDIEWVKNNVDFEYLGINVNILEYREIEQVYNNFEEMYVMASCKHAIISNSTFNFWGAWLIENNNKVVVAPKDWFRDGKSIDIIPPSWIQI